MGGRRRALALSWSIHDGRDALSISGWTGSELRELGDLIRNQRAHGLTVLPGELAGNAERVPGLQPVAGEFVIAGDEVRFVPRFPFLDGMEYAFTIRGEQDVWALRRPGGWRTPVAEVVAVYPSVEEVPVNLLKLYVHFSHSMGEGWAERAVRVRRADNRESLEGVFLPGQELWDPARQRLTLLLDPGRIKRGLVPNQEAGYPLVQGVPVVVGIGKEFRDAAGQPLRAGAERRYVVGPPLRARVDPKDWRLRPPVTGTKDALTVEFDRPLDHALLQHCLWVADVDGKHLLGEGVVRPGELSWQFTPESAWRGGDYALVIDTRLEDLAGNSMARVFDRDLAIAADTPVRGGQAEIEFICSAPVHAGSTIQVSGGKKGSKIKRTRGSARPQAPRVPGVRRPQG